MRIVSGMFRSADHGQKDRIPLAKLLNRLSRPRVVKNDRRFIKLGWRQINVSRNLIGASLAPRFSPNASTIPQNDPVEERAKSRASFCTQPAARVAWKLYGE